MQDFRVIKSRENSLIKLISLLQTSASARKEKRLFVLEGLRLCSDAAENGIRFDKLIVSFSAAEKYGGAAETFASNACECIKVPDSLFSKISDTKSPQGIIAVCRLPEKRNAVIRPDGRYVALENISDPSNLGAVSRTAEALGADGLILSAGGCDPYSPKVLRASMGTVLRLPVFIFEDFASGISSSGLLSYACVVDSAAESISGACFTGGCVIIIGNEANGISEEMKAAADRLVTIPMTGRAESLNAAAAAAIAVWEMMK